MATFLSGRAMAGVSASVAASRRMLGIAHALGGMTISHAARAAGMERQALGDAINRYDAEGLEGLLDRAKPGPRKLDAAQEKELSELLIKGPDPDKDGISAYMGSPNA